MRRNLIIILTALILVAALGVIGYNNRAVIRDRIRPKIDVPAAQPLDSIAIPQREVSATTTTPSPAIDTNTTPTPPEPRPVEEINLAVPFAAQAPFGDWTPTYNEACEEASLIMVDYYLRGSSLSKQQMKDMIDRMVAWQVETWGGHHDIALSQAVDLGQNFYPSYQYQILNNLTAVRIREQLRQGYPVIVPAAGRELHNPNFKQPGPIYHMLVIKGFTKDGKFITNDPGTRNGADYIYTEKVLMDAIHDWTGEAADGSKIGLVIKK